MTIHLSLVIFLPLLGGAIAAFLPARWAASFATAGAFVTLGYVIVAVFKFDAGAGLQFVTNEDWIKQLGIHYRLGIDRISLWLVVVTALLWVPITIVAAVREWDRPRLFFFNLMLAETAILGVFCAQDLALFVLFFDLTLVPFYFLIGAWGGENRVQATTKFVIYTLAGSLLMLAGAVALGVLATPPDGQISFSFADLAQRQLPAGTQYWIFLLFAAAFLVKAPAFPLHGWVPDTYRATPIPVLIGLSAVLSKLGVYGFIAIVLRFLPDASAHFQEAMMLIAIVSILYGSALAFSQDEARLVVGYSSIAQLGFIILGIFSLDPKGVDGAVFQMVNHALVVAPLFLVIAVLADRVPSGSGRLSAMGGLAFRAPVLAALLLIATFATLAMPGSGNFVGELLILFGAFNTKFVYGVVATAGVVLASVYMIRFFQRTMHGREGTGVQSRDILPAGPDLLTIAPLIAVIIALGVCPQIVLSKLDSPKPAPIGQVAQR
ncbi:MAG TPA: NADH-quinone oxidoreductase subunit M [Thermoleophilaceae bacterium]|jgi:NADH-quinone oxidoreductase subunit M|nr:NADH-quinone oxidoreductase subunit M [Thermoleophilaceae bacterium]